MKMKCFLFALAVLVSGMASDVFADIKIKSRQTSAGQSYESSTFIKGRRQRVENMDGANVTITQCDTRREIRLNPFMKTYSISPFSEDDAAGARTAVATPGTISPTVRGGTVTLTTTTRDTGERKQMFGYTSRRVLSTIVYESSADACSVANNRIEIDGWYIDDNFGFDCGDQRRPEADLVEQDKGGCKDKFVRKNVGTTKRGFALIEETTIFVDGETEGFTTKSEVLELSKSTLEASLFDVPEGYSLVSAPADPYSSSAVAAAAAAAMRGSIGGIPPGGVAPAASGQTDIGTNNIEAKRPGVIRIGLAEVKVTEAADGISAMDLAAAFESTLIDSLRSGDIEVVFLDSKYPATLEVEAKQKECDYILYGQVAYKKGGGGFGKMFGKVIAPAVANSGIGPAGSVAGNIGARVATGAIVSAAAVAVSIKSKDEITLDIRLQRSGGSQILGKQFKQKAKSDGQDIITPIVEEAASAVASVIGNRTAM